MNPTRRHALAGLAALAVAGAGAGWWYDRKRSLKVPSSLLVAGSSTMYPLNRALLDEFAKARPEVVSELQGGGSMAGLIALQRGAIDVAAMSRDLTEAEDTSATRSHLVAINDVSIVVHPALALESITRAQLRSILSGQVANWQAVGGPNAPVRVASRSGESAALRFVLDEVLAGDDFARTARAYASAQDLAAAVANDRQAIGFLAHRDAAAHGVKPLAIDGVKPERASVLSGRYPLTQPHYLVLHGAAPAAAEDFVAFARSRRGQEIVAATGLWPAA